MSGCLRVQLRIPCEECGYPLSEARYSGENWKDIKHTTNKAWMEFDGDSKTGIYVICRNCNERIHIEWSDKTTKFCPKCECELVYPHWCEW